MNRNRFIDCMCLFARFYSSGFFHRVGIRILKTEKTPIGNKSVGVVFVAFFSAAFRLFGRRIVFLVFKQSFDFVIEYGYLPDQKFHQSFSVLAYGFRQIFPNVGLGELFFDFFFLNEYSRFDNGLFMFKLL